MKKKKPSTDINVTAFEILQKEKDEMRKRIKDLPPSLLDTARKQGRGVK